MIIWAAEENPTQQQIDEAVKYGDGFVKLMDLFPEAYAEMLLPEVMSDRVRVAALAEWLIKEVNEKYNGYYVRILNPAGSPLFHYYLGHVIGSNKLYQMISVHCSHYSMRNEHIKFV